MTPCFIKYSYKSKHVRLLHRYMQEAMLIQTAHAHADPCVQLSVITTLATLPKISRIATYLSSLHRLRNMCAGVCALIEL